MHDPALRSVGRWDSLLDLARHLVLPTLVLTGAGCPGLIRHVRAAMVEVLDAPFLHAARAHGLPPTRVLVHYALRAALNPMTSLLGFSVAALLSGSLLVEVVVGWPGIGPLLLEAVLARDICLVIGAVMASTLFLVSGSLLADALLYACDPRIRTEGA
jgi:peptide/nickel transport system permease protein